MSPGPALEAVIFDLDGVLTDTAALHLAAWQRLFSELLAAHPEAEPFTEADYLSYVDGRRRIDGVAAVLASRHIELAMGAAGDPPDRETVAGLAARKDEYYLQLLHDRGPRSFPSSVALVNGLHRRGLRTAVVSGSRHCVQVLAAAGIEQLFDARVDGIDADRLGLAGKPEPAAFLEAARRLGVAPERAAVVEAAIAGVEAGRRGGFALVVGVDRHGRPGTLADAGADLVVPDLAELTIEPLGPGRARLVSSAGTRSASAARPGLDAWTWSYDGHDAVLEGLRETLCTLGNGYFATRGAAPEARQDEVHYPGTYVAGCYNRLTTYVDGVRTEDESLVNLPNWLDLRLRIEDGEWLEPSEPDLSEYRRSLDLRRGLLVRRVGYRDGRGRRILVVEHRLVSMADPHLAAQKVTVTAGNWSGRLHARIGLDARVANLGVRADRGFASQHMVSARGEAPDSDMLELAVETSQSRVRVVEAARVRVRLDERVIAPESHVVAEEGYIGRDVSLDVRQGQTLSIEKVVAIHTSRDHAVSEPGLASAQAVRRAGSFDELLARHEAAWERLWSRFRFSVGDEHADRILRLHAFHLLQTLSRHTMEVDAGAPARGLHGEGYRGHVFWDEVVVLPLLTYRLPELTRELLRYRYRRLPAARRLAAEAGSAGALFPWQSGSDGREETPTRLFNPRSGHWMRDNSRLQRHVDLAVAYNVWHYYEVTGDLEFLADYGAELLVEIARFFAGLTVLDAERGRYVIRGVMGPDEFHDAYLGADRAGIDNNAYTNVMVVWLLRRAADALAVLHGYHRRELVAVLDVADDELARWRDITARMFVPFHDGVISQFEGYEKLAELDWDAYRRRYGNIGRLDLILEAEGDTTNRYRLSKQADVLMLLYLLSAEELRGLLTGLGYPLSPEMVRRTVEYYLARSSHGSTLSRVVDAWILARSDRRRSWAYFAESLAADIADTQGGTTAEGIHLGAMTGTLDIVQRCYTGLEARDGVLWLNPQVPEELGSLEVDLLYRGHWLTLGVRGNRVRLGAQSNEAAPTRVGIAGRIIEVRAGDTHQVEIPT